MKVIIAFLFYTILHIVAFGALVLAYIGIIYPGFLVIALTIVGLLLLIDILLVLYYLIKKPCKKEGSGYHKLKIEEADKRLIEENKKKINILIRKMINSFYYYSNILIKITK